MDNKGLTKQEVADRIARGLRNKSSAHSTKTIREILAENIFSLFNLVILSIILFLLYFYFSSSDKRLLYDSIGILTIALVNTFIAVFQELKAKRALDQVNLLLSKEVIVIREGQEVSIDPAAIVKDDVIRIERGDQVVVDGNVIVSNHLEIDESLLTGESNPVHKQKGDEILSGSFCLSGKGYYTAEKIGDSSFASEVTKTAKKYKFDLTPLQRKINTIVKVLFASAIVLVLLEIAFNNEGFTPDFVRKISTILISLVPQGLVLMATVTFAVGVYRISKLGAIVQRLNAIESFSNVKVVCTDKTGTLTQNKLSVHSINFFDSGMSEQDVRKLAGTYASLTGDKNATIAAISTLEADSEYRCADEIPFSSERKMSMVLAEKGTEKEILILGAFDVLKEMLAENNRSEAEKIFSERKLEVYRNLLFGKMKGGVQFSDAAEALQRGGMIPLCIISIKDIIRDDVFEAIKLFDENGIRIKILSGDSSKAVQEVAREIGWNIKDDDMISGAELDRLDEQGLASAVNSKIIFSRLLPEHKLRIIRTLKSQKIHTAMLGDGVNDLPAIKEADLGIAMEEGSSITKEVADIVLLKNKFSLLPSIFDEGNKIVNTVKSVGKLFITKNFFVIYITLMSLIFLLDFPLTPRRVSLINIFGIGLPAFIITLKNSDVSRSRDFMKDLISFVLLSALVIVAAGYSGIYFANLLHRSGERDLQMVMLTIMIITNIANYFSIVLKRDDDNKLFYLLYGFAILLLYMFLAVTSINSGLIRLVKGFYEIHTIEPDLWSIVITISIVASVLLFMLQKLREKILNLK